MNTSVIFYYLQLPLLTGESQTVDIKRYARYDSGDTIIFDDYNVTKIPVHSLLKCASTCARTNDKEQYCHIFTVTGNGRGKECWLYSKQVSGTSPTTTTELTTIGWREQSCVSNTECLEENWECFNGLCLCTPGYYYSLSTKQCILECPTANLSASYMKYPNSGMYGANIRRVDGTVDDCKAACSSEPLCLTFEYEWSADGTGLGCYLQDMTAITYPAGWSASEALWDQYQKHCT